MQSESRRWSCALHSIARHVGLTRHVCTAPTLLVCRGLLVQRCLWVRATVPHVTDCDFSPDRLGSTSCTSCEHWRRWKFQDDRRSSYVDVDRVRYLVL